MSNEMDDFATDDFQELLDSLSGLTVVPPNGGKRGGRKGSNIGADVLGITMLTELLKNHHVDFANPANIKTNFLYGVIDSNSVKTADQKSKGIKPSYGLSGILAIQIAQTSEKVVYLQQWKGNVVNGTLSFQKADSPYQLVVNPENGCKSFWKVNKKGEYFLFPFSSIVSFEDYLDAIVGNTELLVSFPNEEVSKLQGLAEILANVNINAVVNSNSVVDSDNEDDSEFEDEDEEEEV